MTCRICGGGTTKAFTATILGHLSTHFHTCAGCGFLQTDPPHWLDEAYTDAVSAIDTGIMQRNLRMANLSSLIIAQFFNPTARFLDCAGGYGILVRLMRDLGFDFVWADRYCQNLIARGFEHHEGSTYELASCFEAFEHFPDPMTEIEAILSLAPNILFSTLVLPQPVPEPSWWYYSLDHGQHVSFYAVRTLFHIARRFGKHYATNGVDLHLFSDKRINVQTFRDLCKIADEHLTFTLSGRLPSKTWDDHLAMRSTVRVF